MIKEFQEFIMRGNVLDLAVGVVIGGAFTAIVNALVEFIITPVVVALSGEASVENLAVSIGSATIQYGQFIQAIIDFLIIGLVLFLFVKFINRFKRKQEETAEVEPEISSTEKYLREIRDALVEKETALPSNLTDKDSSI
ncbi:large conductance mechanosensitive channel protein MscL [Lacticigenium naphthae]|uniref:large conductance mechanosensitive channel protein MscL n=1 Tax=Lacticigenium naphthae TaxID=515351 RepID=UPI000401A464|nr:large conductance mechanosensitive channel protein MscL [Lacticigenium naphthae]